jgi:HK97 family phage major capsid protein
MTEIRNPVERAKYLDDLILRHRSIVEERAAINSIAAPNTGHITRSADLERAAEKLTDEIAIERAAMMSGNLATEGGTFDTFNVNRGGNPWTDTDGTETPNVARSRAIAGIERWNASDELKESAIATVTRAGAGTDAVTSAQDARGVAAHVLRYSDPLYVSAFRKYARDPETYVADLTSEEAAVWRSAREIQRATLQTSGAVLPSPYDPTIVLTNDSVTDPMRQLARVDTTTSNSKRYITSAGSSFSFDAELAEVSDDTFTETEVEIDTHKAQGWIESSIEVWMDQPNFETEVAKIIADGKARLEAGKFITGTGTNEPTGIEVALNATASEINAAGEALAASDVYGLLHALPPRWRDRATWQMEMSTRSFIHRLYNPSGSEPALIEGDRLLGLPYALNSSIDPYSAVNAAATASNRVLFIGDWSQYVCLDRIGLSVFFVAPGHIVNTANNRPDGRVGWYAMWRTGGEPLTTSAFKMLDVATVA